MDFSSFGVSPISSMGQSIVADKAIRTEEDASKAFVSLFLSKILKDVMKSQSTLFNEKDSASSVASDMYSDLLIKKISDDLSKDNLFGFGEMLATGSNVNFINAIGNKKTI